MRISATVKADFGTVGNRCRSVFSRERKVSRHDVIGTTPPRTPSFYDTLCPMQKSVFIALKMSVIAGQAKLAGIFRYLNERYGERSPWNIQLVRSRLELTRERINGAIAEKTDGFIISIPNTEDALEPLSRTGTPAVVMDVRCAPLTERRRGIVFIRHSAEAIGREAAHFLVKQGVARSYAFLHAVADYGWSRLRCDAFRSELRETGLWCEELRDPSQVTKLKRPAAVLAANDEAAFELLKFLRAKHLSVPREIAVLGVDNDTLLCENIHPRLSSIQPDFEREGFMAAEALDAMMHGRKTGRRTLLADVVKVVNRESTADPSPAGKLVQKAVTFIDRHATEGIGVDDVVRHLKCSRRLADMRFRELQKRTILEAITERRLEEVKRLLTETDDTVETIAGKCGYKSASHLMSLFRTRFSMTMRDFRRTAARNMW